MVVDGNEDSFHILLPSLDRWTDGEDTPHVGASGSLLVG